MWLYLPNSFLSIIDPAAAYAGGGDKGPRLVVRGRFKGDIERVFPTAHIIETTDRDYRFRALIDRRDVATALYNEVMDLDYQNVKGATKEPWRHDAYAACHAVMEREQRRHNEGRPIRRSDLRLPSVKMTR